MKKHKNLKRNYIILLLIFIVGWCIVAATNYYFFARVFENSVAVPSIICITILSVMIIQEKYSKMVFKIFVVILLVMYISLPFLIPRYTYNKAANVVLNDLKVKDNIKGKVDYNISKRKIASRIVPSFSVRDLYVIKVITIDGDERYFYFNASKGNYIEGPSPIKK